MGEQGNEFIATSLNNIGKVYYKKMKIIIATLNQKVKGNPVCPFCTSQKRYKKCCTTGRRKKVAKECQEQALEYIRQSRSICYRIGLEHRIPSQDQAIFEIKGSII